jgi:alanine dehydrogenase
VGAELLAADGHEVLVEKGAGQGSGFSDEQYARVGVRLVDSAGELHARAEMIVKVKEPQPAEIARLRKGQIVFTYFHFAASRDLTEGCLRAGIAAVAYETLADPNGKLPLLTPMSEIAGKMSIQEGAKYLERPMMGRGILLGGVPGVAPGNVLVLGAGVVGTNAARVAAELGANVTIMDVNLDRLRYLDEIMPTNVTGIYSDPHAVADALPRADLVIGAVLIPGSRAPRLVRRDQLATMQSGGRHRGRVHRPGRLRRDGQADDAPRADVHRRQRGSLLRDQHAWRGGPDQQPGALQLHFALCAKAGLAWRGEVRRSRCRPWPGREHARRPNRQPRRG